MVLQGKRALRRQVFSHRDTSVGHESRFATANENRTTGVNLIRLTSIFIRASQRRGLFGCLSCEPGSKVHQLPNSLNSSNLSHDEVDSQPIFRRKTLMPSTQSIRGLQTLFLMLVFSSSALLVNGSPETPIVLWPDGAPGAVGKAPTDIPTLTPYPAPKDKATGAAIIVCPGAAINTSQTTKAGPSQNGLTLSA